MIFNVDDGKFTFIGNRLAESFDNAREKLIELNDVYENHGVFSDNGVWDYLFMDKNKISDMLSKVTPEISFNDARDQLNEFNREVISGGMDLDEYFKEYQEGNKLLRQYVTVTDQQSQSVQGYIKYTKDARNAQIAQINVMKQQTLSAKAASVAMKALAMAGNMIAMWAITAIITKAAEAINNYVHRVEIAREKLEETTSELESVGSELKDINKQIDEILAKDDITLTDENDLKRLQLENAELERRQKLLKLQRQEDSKELNEEIEDKYKNQFQKKNVSIWIPEDERINTVNPNQTRATKSVTQEEKFEYSLKLAKELAAYEGQVTEEQQKKYEELQTYFLDMASSLSELTQGYEATTPEQEKQLAIWNQMIDDAIWVSENFPGSAGNVTTRLMGKFAGGFDKNNGAHYLSSEFSDEDKQIATWIDSLSEDNKKILLGCDIENPSLDDLKKYLEDNIPKIVDDAGKIELSDIFALEDAEGELNTLGQLNEQLDNIQSAYNSLKEAMDNYSATGTITIDQFQDIISHGSKFLDYLDLENGALSLDEQAMYELAEARIIEMKAQIVQGIVDNVTGIQDETQAATYLASTNYELAESYHELASAKLEAWYNNAIENGFDKGVADEVKKKAENDIAKIDAMKIDFSSIYSGKSSVSNSDILEKEITALEKSAEAGTITYKEYLSERERLVNDYYKRGKIKAEEYYAELEKLAQARVDYYDKVLAAIERRFDREIDKIQDAIEEIEKQNKLLEKQKEKYDSALDAIQDLIDAEKEKHQDQIDDIEKENDAIQDQIDKYDQLLSAVTLVFDEKREAIQDEIDAIDDRIEKLQDENDEYQKQLELEKAKDALLKARNQRSKYLYAGEGKGFIYQTDTDAIAEAEETLSNLTFQSTIDALEKEKELLNDVIEQLDETEKKWQEISNAFDDQKAKSTAQELFGDDYENIILNGDPEMIASIMNQYTGAQQKLEDNESLITSINEKITKLDELSEKWNEIADEHEKAVNREHAAALLGSQWEKLILEDRQFAYDTFKTNYLNIESQIYDNTLLIESYNEKIEYYNGLKEQWQEIKEIYQDSVDNQLLKSEELTLEEGLDLLTREENIETFKKAYVDAQEALAKAAEDSARRQVQAAKEAKAAQDYLDSLANNRYKVIDELGNTLISYYGPGAEEKAKSFKNGLDDGIHDLNKIKIVKYHGGLDEGYVGSQFRPLSDDERLNLLRKASIDGLKSNEVPAILQEGELVLTKDQIKGITNSLVAPNYYSSLMNGLSSLPQGIQNRETNITQHISVTLPNITNTGGYENFVRAMNQLSNDALQFSKRN